MQQLKKLPIIYSDVFISLGNTCKSAYWLQYAKLRKFALPLDWMRFYSLDTVLDMIKDKKISYFEDFTETPIENSLTRHITCNISKIECIHHFPMKYSVKEYLPTFLSMFNRRKIRFQNIIKTYKNICFVTNRVDKVENIITFLKEVTILYPKTKFTMINVRKKEYSNYINKYIIPYCKYLKTRQKNTFNNKNYKPINRLFASFSIISHIVTQKMNSA